ncbi:MAG: formate dehydrogenase, partial [Brevibacterium sp.]
MARFSFLEWPVLRQFRTSDTSGRGESVTSQKTRDTTARTSTADKVVQSVCPYCAVGCGQKVFVKDDKVVQIEGDPDSPISRGRLCPKGAASEQLVNSKGRVTDVLYRAPKAKDWQKLDLNTAIDMIADRFIEARRNHWEDFDD